MIHIFVQIGIPDIVPEHFKQVKGGVATTFDPGALKEIFPIKVDAINIDEVLVLKPDEERF